MNECVFCNIVSRTQDRALEAENDLVVAFKSIAPTADIHILIVPKKHIPAITDVEAGDNEIFSSMISMAQDLIKSKNISDGYRLIFNGGKYQSVPHLHWHLLGGNLNEGSDSKT